MLHVSFICVQCSSLFSQLHLPSHCVHAKMASQMSYEDVLKIIQDNTNQKLVEARQKASSIDIVIGTHISNATSLPIKYTYALSTDIAKMAWEILTGWYKERFGDKCEMRTFNKVDRHDDDVTMVTYGEFILN